MEGDTSQSCSSSVGSGSTRLCVCLCGLPAMMKTAWTNRNFGRRYNKCANEVCKYWDWVDPPISLVAEHNANDGNLTSSSFEALPDPLKKTGPELHFREKEGQVAKNDEDKKAKNDLDKLEMLTNMEQLLKESQRRDEMYFKILMGIWAIIGCLLLALLKMITDH